MRLTPRDHDKVVEMARGIENHYSSIKIVANARLIGKATEHRLYWLSLALLDAMERLEPQPKAKRHD